MLLFCCDELCYIYAFSEPGATYAMFFEGFGYFLLVPVYKSSL